MHSISRQQPFTMRPGRLPGWRRWLVMCFLCLGACSSLPSSQTLHAQISPLQLGSDTVGQADIPFFVDDSDLLSLDEEMKSFVERYTAGMYSQQQRLVQLHRAIKGDGVLDIQYDPAADGSAKEAFHRGTVNCLSYSHLLIAMAREAGLQASYQRMDVRPRWTRLGERMAVGLHVNVVVKLNGGDQYMADIAPLERSSVLGADKISDREAAALHYGNVAMGALAENELASAWAYAVRALQISPRVSHLWVNLGAVYRVAGQHAEAEHSYLYALQLDAGNRSAMNNLAVLYGMQGRVDERDHWQQKIHRYQRENPYYHASMGDLAAQEGDWPEALKRYTKALDLEPQDSHFLYAMGLIYERLDDRDAALRMISLAITHASLDGEARSYQVKLDELQRQDLAGL